MDELGAWISGVLAGSRWLFLRVHCREYNEGTMYRVCAGLSDGVSPRD